MAELARHRPIFHSEADFRFALAWQIKKLNTAQEVRLERSMTSEPKRGSKIEHLDLWVVGSTDIFIELKYRTRLLTVESHGEHFSLRAHSAADVGRYLFIRDLERLEKFVSSRSASKGYAVLLTNDASFWEVPRDRRKLPNDSQFRIHEGSTVPKNPDWARPLSDSMRSKFPSISLSRSYQATWNDFSALSDGPNGKFRYLVVEVFDVCPVTAPLAAVTPTPP
jgi:hypothetical protein